MVIEKASDVSFDEKGNQINFKGILESIENSGDQDKRRPITIVVRLENDDVLKCATWDYGMLDLFKQAIESNTYANFGCTAKLYHDRENIIINKYELTEEKPKTSKTKKSPESISSFYKKAITKMIKGEVKNPMFLKLLEELLVPEFFTWKAAKSIHHNFEGGLAMHSFNVAASALNIAKVYDGFSMVNKELIVTSALLHDIGKLYEYNENGTYSIEGQLLSHIPIGIYKVLSAVEKLGYSTSDPLILQLVHIISSHHGKLEFGSPNLPSIPEALIVSHADCLDAQMEAARIALNATNVHNASEKVFSLGTSVVKFDKANGE